MKIISVFFFSFLCSFSILAEEVCIFYANFNLVHRPGSTKNAYFKCGDEDPKIIPVEPTEVDRKWIYNLSIAEITTQLAVKNNLQVINCSHVYVQNKFKDITNCFF